MPLLVALSAAALAWNVDTTAAGDPLHWEVMPIEWVLVNDAAPELDGLEEAVVSAFETWTWVDGAEVMFVREDGDVPSAEPDNDGRNLVYFDADWPTDEPAIGLASTWSDESGRVLGFDIRLDAGAGWSTTGAPDAYDLQAALTHEIGHALGIEHSEIQEATMFGAHARGDTWRRALVEDDQDALRYLYGPLLPDGPSPASRPDTAITAEEWAAAWSCATGPSAPAPAGVLLLVAVGIVRTRRARLP